MSATKRCVVAYATSSRQYLWTIELPQAASIADALVAARAAASSSGRDVPAHVPWDTARVGIFGELRERTHQPSDGDRIELYRPLRADPRERRRQRVQQARKSRR